MKDMEIRVTKDNEKISIPRETIAKRAPKTLEHNSDGDIKQFQHTHTIFWFHRHKRGQPDYEYKFVNKFKQHVIPKCGMRNHEVISIMGRYLIGKIQNLIVGKLAYCKGNCL